MIEDLEDNIKSYDKEEKLNYDENLLINLINYLILINLINQLIN